MPHIVLAVKGMLVANRRVLMLQRGPGARYAPNAWEFPGGKLNFGEELEEALLREIQEETGLAATVDCLLYASTAHTGPERQIVVLYYLCRAKDETVALSPEHERYRWANYSCLQKHLLPEVWAKLQKYRVFDEVGIEGSP